MLLYADSDNPLISAENRYTENYVTDKEFESLTPRVQEHIKRLAAANAAQQNGMYTGYFSPANVPSRFRRVGM